MRPCPALPLAAAVIAAAVLAGCGSDDEDRPATTVAEFFVMPELVPTFERRLEAHPALFAGAPVGVEQCGRIGDRVACLVRVQPPASAAPGTTGCVLEFANADRPRPSVAVHEVDDAGEPAPAGSSAGTPEEQCDRRAAAVRRGVARLPDGL